MKTITFIFLSLFIAKGCSQQQKEEMKNTSIEYQAMSRGFYLNIVIKDKELVVVKERDGKPELRKISSSDWNELSDLFLKIKPEDLSKFKVPSENRFVDAAAIGNLRVIYEGKLYESESFDHGNPPKEIKNLVNKIISIAKIER
ncbi:hypothetical protein [Flavobacterium sp. UBA6135]|uniref:hypothetical protein n=1 Tax=Flavobacterium sp. UBA6135 TaxID=1946553 RepID=UPI0025BA8B95|nr:hypothetical protein [Flavobacterium sp. UBA6135]